MSESDVQLPQSLADRLFAEPKVSASRDTYQFTNATDKLSVSLVSIVSGEVFTLDIVPSKKRPDKISFQLRARGSVVLARLDIGGPAHRNPDRTTVPCPQLHIYREPYNDRWAIPAPVDVFPNMHDLGQTLYDFMEYCNVIQPPSFG